MKILITGAAGFIGSHTAERLVNLGHEVVGLDNFSDYYLPEIKRNTAKSLSQTGVTIVEADLTEDNTYQKLPRDFDYIFHFAAQPGIAATSTFESYFLNNFIATQKLLQFTKQLTDIKLFVNIATSSIYGREAYFSEEKEPMPTSYYGVTKMAAEQLALMHSREDIFKVCSLRLYSVYGPRERPDKLYPKLIDSAFNNTPFTLFEGSEKHLRSFTFVEDIVDGIVSVVGKDALLDGEIINLGTEVESTTQEGINTVEELTGKKLVIQVVPKRSGDQLRTCAVINKAKRLLQYQPKTSLKEGLKKHIDWYLKVHNE